MHRSLAPIRKVAFGGTAGLVALAITYFSQLTGGDLPVGVGELVVFAATTVVAYLTGGNEAPTRSHGVPSSRPHDE